MPTTKIEIGSVAKACAGASVLPMIAPVAKITTEFAPAWATANRATLPNLGDLSPGDLGESFGHGGTARAGAPGGGDQIGPSFSNQPQSAGGQYRG